MRCINARRARATAFPYKESLAGREGGLSEPRARLVKFVRSSGARGELTSEYWEKYCCRCHGFLIDDFDVQFNLSLRARARVGTTV